MELTFDYGDIGLRCKISGNKVNAIEFINASIPNRICVELREKLIAWLTCHVTGDVPVDEMISWDYPEFTCKVLRAVLEIPSGYT